MKKTPVLILAALALSGGTAFADYDWQKPHAKVLPGGDLAWAPEAWKTPKLAHPRYIDFDGGDDAKDGKTPATAWPIAASSRER